MNIAQSILAFSLVLIITGCSTTEPESPRYVDPGAQGSVSGMGIESQDLIAATDKMVRKILETPAIQSSKGGTPVIALLPVENKTRFAIDQDIFNARMKALLNEKSEGRLTFVARDHMDAITQEKKKKDAGAVSSGIRRQALGADYFLTGELSGLSTSSSKGKSDYLLFTFRLIDTETSAEVWEGYHELKKEGTEDVIYR